LHFILSWYFLANYHNYREFRVACAPYIRRNTHYTQQIRNEPRHCQTTKLTKPQLFWIAPTCAVGLLPIWPGSRYDTHMALQIEHHTTIHTHGERGIKEHVQLSLSLSLSHHYKENLFILGGPQNISQIFLMIPRRPLKMAVGIIIIIFFPLFCFLFSFIMSSRVCCNVNHVLEKVWVFICSWLHIQHN